MLNIFKIIYDFLNADIIKIVDMDVTFSIWDIAVFSVVFIVIADIIAHFVTRNR